MVYVGTYTGAGSRGIYRFGIDPRTGETTPVALAAESENPSFLGLHPSRRVLYAVSETEGFGGANTGSVAAFAIDPATAGLGLLNQVSSAGGSPCHLSVDRAGRYLLVANYGNGSVAVLPLEPDGRLRPASVVRHHEGRGPNPSRQEAPHAHGVVLDLAERFAFAPDLGADRIFVYRFDPSAGTLEPGDPSAASLEPGAGPRHVAFHPSGRFLYCINELDSTVSTFAYDSTRGALSEVQTITTLPAEFTGASTTAEIQVAPDGLHVYGSNRGHDSLVVFEVDRETGRLTTLGHVPTGGRTPRHFAIDPSGRWLLVANQGSDTVTVFGLADGVALPVPVGEPVPVPKPACVLMVPSAP